MKDIVIYEKPTCSKCRAAISLLDKSGRPFARVKYHEERLSQRKIGALLAKLKMSPQEIMRTKEPLYRGLGLNARSLTEKEAVRILAKHPELIERPILEYGNRAVLGRPTENVSKFLEEIGEMG